MTLLRLTPVQPSPDKPTRRPAPPRHLADLDTAGRRSAVAALGEREFRAGRYNPAMPFISFPVGPEYLHSDVPAVLSIALPRQDGSTRWKEVAHPAPRTWMHHLELRAPCEVDDEVRQWLGEAYASAG